MYKDVLRSIEGIELFPVIGIVIFFTFFMAWVIYVVKMKNSHIDELSAMPLEFDSDIQNEGNQHEKTNR